jgi:hypothetical protein
MRIRKPTFLVFLGISILLNGCVTLNLRQANHELADLYRAKSEAINNKQWEQEITVNAALSALADEASAQGADKFNSEVNRISFYRIAATAAWQAGDAKVVEYASDGFSICSPENYGKAPRDCGMLAVIPDFASVDELTKRIDDIQRRISAGPTPPSEQEVVQLFDDIKSRIDSLLAKRDPIKKSSAHPALIQGIDKRTGTILCTHLQTAKVLIVRVAGDKSDAHRKARCDDYKLKGKMKELGFSQQNADCLPTGDLSKPPDCQ